MVQLSEPVNRFPAYVGYLVRWLKSMCPAMGKLRIAQTLARAGPLLGATTVRKMLRESPDPRDPAEAALTEEADEPVVVSTRVLKAKRPDHIWHVDLTLVPTSAGFWIPWRPFSKALRWPFCWWVAVVIDQSSRRVCGFALFKKKPSSKDLCGFLGRVMTRTGTKPAYIVTDQGRQFISSTFEGWCRRRHVRVRYGAVGEHDSVAVIERFIRSMKSECTRQILVPFRLDATREELALYVMWYNEHRPHQGLNGMTPNEVYRGEASPNADDRFEPRPRWPLTGKTRGSRADRLHLTIKFVEGRRHLPVVELSRAA